MKIPRAVARTAPTGSEAVVIDEGRQPPYPTAFADEVGLFLPSQWVCFSIPKSFPLTFCVGKVGWRDGRSAAARPAEKRVRCREATNLAKKPAPLLIKMALFCQNALHSVGSFM